MQNHRKVAVFYVYENGKLQDSVEFTFNPPLDHNALATAKSGIKQNNGSITVVLHGIFDAGPIDLSQDKE